MYTDFKAGEVLGFGIFYNICTHQAHSGDKELLIIQAT